MNMAGFQVEQILSQLKELRQEKSRNEHLLKLLQQERRNLESKVEAAVMRYGIAKEDKEREVDGLNVAEKKFEHLEEQLTIAEQKNSERRREVSSLNNRLEVISKEFEDECRSVEESLTGLSKKLRNAKDFYAKDGLEEQIVNNEEEKLHIQAKMMDQDSTLDALTTDLEGLRVQTKDKGEMLTVYGIPVMIWLALKDLLGRECEALGVELEGIKEQLKEGEERFQELDGSGLAHVVQGSSEE